MLLFCNMSILCCHTYHPVDTEIFKAYKGNYQKSAELVELHSECFLSGKNCDKAAMDFSLIGDYPSTLSTWDLQGFNTYIQASDSLENPENYIAVDYYTYIDTLSDSYQVVMTNEAHHRPECRILTTELVKRLKEKGFGYLGVEGLKENKDALRERGFPNLNSGYYIREPQYANLLRIALRLGYEVFPYDNKPGRSKQREIHQAAEINAILQEDPKGRILIHAGWGHIREDTAIMGGLMAYEFKKISGNDPLTISQPRYMPMSESKFENPFYKRIASIKAPSVLLNRSGSGFYKDAMTDVLLFHPRSGLSYFLKKDCYARKVMLNIKEDVILLVIPISDELVKLPVPVYTREIKKGRQTVKVYLPFKGQFNLYLLSVENMYFFKKISVK